jgi:hypothetical protein
LHKSFRESTEDTILLSSLQDISQNYFQMEISSFKDGYELQIPVVVSRNLVCVDEYLYFQEDSEKIFEFPYSEFPFEHCCNEELESVIEYKKIAFTTVKKRKNFLELSLKMMSVMDIFIRIFKKRQCFFIHTY